uniref:Chitobiosyldiphosphodolichol beta-mannosyltransferase n=1 Tax=Arion vulgaris TaxID=1028688 RepID=A0A0B6Y8V7_9EUPU
MSFSLDVLFYTPIVFVLLYLLVNFLFKVQRNLCIVVLGDIGRSPRVQYHALSFAKEGFRIYLVGYEGSTPHKNVLENENIQIYHMSQPPAFLTKMPRLLGYFLKALWQSIILAWTLLLLPNMSSIFIQNPPSIPTMFVSFVVCKIRFCELVIDWHNYGYTILSMALRAGHPLVRFAKWYEKKCAKLSSHNICVTNAMKQDLESNWNIRATTVHDRPAELFKSADVTQQHQLLLRLGKEHSVFLSSESVPDSTRFTKRNQDGTIVKVDNRPAILVSSTSWTEDEDFGILLDALEEYDKRDVTGDGSRTLPELICVITGKGPQKEHYSQIIAEKQWKKVTFCLPWLTAEDYPLMLASADVGVCLHKSSSGLDLPMKVVDMFGCGLPVCAINFNCIDELVQHGKNGLVFNDSQELVQQLVDLLDGFPHKTNKLNTYRKNLTSFQALRWHQQWKKLVLPIFYRIGKIEDPAFSIPDLFGSPQDNSKDAARDVKNTEHKKDK